MDLLGRNINNIVGNLWQRQETEQGSGSSNGNLVSLLFGKFSFFLLNPGMQFIIVFGCTDLDPQACVYFNSTRLCGIFSNIVCGFTAVLSVMHLL